jgi:hypothetical protein
MRKMKRLVPIALWALVAMMSTSQVLAGPGEMVGVAAQGTSEAPGIMAAILDYLILFF